MKNKILIPVDFEQQSILNLEWAKYFAQHSNSRIILSYILEETNFMKRMFKQDNLAKVLEERAKDELKSLAERHFATTEKYECIVKKGKVYEEIEDLAEDYEPEMIILGKNENSAKKNRRLGSNTLHIINETDYPVVTVFGNQKPEIEDTILLPLDLSKNTTEQITVAYEYAKRYNAKIYAITINTNKSIAHKSKLLTDMDKVKTFFASKEIECNTEIIEELDVNPATLINKVADKLSPMFVIIMIREESNFKQLFIGSTAKEIIENCNAPVLSVKPWSQRDDDAKLFDVLCDPFGIL